jgi:hypothetical protein
MCLPLFAYCVSRSSTGLLTCDILNSKDFSRTRPTPCELVQFSDSPTVTSELEV